MMFHDPQEYSILNPNYTLSKPELCCEKVAEDLLDNVPVLSPKQ